MNRQKSPATRLALTLLGVTAVAVSIMIVGSRLLEGGNRPFSPQQWQAGNHDDRQAMIADLLESRVLLGRSQDDVREMLGEPSQVDDVGPEEIWWSYEVFEGPRGGRGLLFVVFRGDPMKVVDYRLTE